MHEHACSPHGHVVSAKINSQITLLLYCNGASADILPQKFPVLW